MSGHILQLLPGVIAQLMQDTSNVPVVHIHSTTDCLFCPQTCKGKLPAMCINQGCRWDRTSLRMDRASVIIVAANQPHTLQHTTSIWSWDIRLQI